LTWLWLDSPYVIAARKLFNWALEANNAGDPFPVWKHAQQAM
jgi:gamma-glutamyl hydrolase